MESITDIELLLTQQINTLLIYLERPAIYIQLVILGIILALSYLFQHFAGPAITGLLRPNHANAIVRNIHRLFLAMEHLYLSVASLLVVMLMIPLLQREGWPYGLLEGAVPVLILLLLYQTAVALCYLRFNETTARFIRSLILLPLITGILVYQILDLTFNVRALGNLQLVDGLGFTVTLATIFRLLLIIYIIYILSRFLQQSIERVMQRSTPGSASQLTTLLVVLRYALLGIGGLIAASSLGLNTTTLLAIGGGLSVGIGIGLQNVVANLISGIILLFEQSLRPGDVIEIDGRLGTVEDLNIRATTISTFDNVQVIVPNNRFFTSEVVSYTRGSPMVRLNLDFGVSYNEDPKRIREIVLEAAQTHGLVLETPPPQVHFLAFGDSSLDFRLLVSIDQPRRINVIRSDLYYILWEALEKNNVEIPFPQRDLHLRTGWESGPWPPDNPAESPESAGTTSPSSLSNTSEPTEKSAERRAMSDESMSLS